LSSWAAGAAIAEARESSYAYYACRRIDFPYRRRRDHPLRRHISRVGVSRPTVGLILIIAGIVGLVLALIYMLSARRRVVERPYEDRRRYKEPRV
jgi:hypothetical protein